MIVESGRSGFFDGGTPMRPALRVTALATVILVAAGTAFAQTSVVLNRFEVQQLVAGGGPDDQLRLRDHFLALAARYAAEAERNEALAAGLVGNPNRNVPRTPGGKFARLAAQNRGWAQTARELAAHHERVAAGTFSTPPADSARFEAGLGGTTPTEHELHRFAAAARTPAAHKALEEYYLAAAAEHRAFIDRHVAMAQGIRGNVGRRTLAGDPAVHCDRAIREAQRAEEHALGSALAHRQLATIG